mgnify:CR=1 FL=1
MSDKISFADEIAQTVVTELLDYENLSMTQVGSLQAIDALYSVAGVTDITAPIIIAAWNATGLTY